MDSKHTNSMSRCALWPDLSTTCQSGICAVLVAVLKRTEKGLEQTPGEKSQGPVRIGELEIDENNYQAKLKGKLMDLTKTEFSLLRELLKAKGKLKTRDALLEAVWGFDSYGDSRTIDTHLSRLRQKLGKAGERIETVRGVGFRYRV